MFTLSNAVSSAVGGWLLDSTGLGISGIIWWMAALMVVPGLLWFAWTLFGKSGPGQARRRKCVTRPLNKARLRLLNKKKSFFRNECYFR